VVDLAVLGSRLDSMILKVFSNINDSMILGLYGQCNIGALTRVCAELPDEVRINRSFVNPLCSGLQITQFFS